MATSNAIIYVGQLGVDTFTQSLNGDLYTEIKLALWLTEFCGLKVR